MLLDHFLSCSLTASTGATISAFLLIVCLTSCFLVRVVPPCHEEPTTSCQGVYTGGVVDDGRIRVTRPCTACGGCIGSRGSRVMVIQGKSDGPPVYRLATISGRKKETIGIRLEAIFGTTSCCLETYEVIWKLQSGPPCRPRRSLPDVSIPHLLLLVACKLNS